ncbi:MAG: GNAT family N-acetyltransferase [Chloroflexia bacterium]
MSPLRPGARWEEDNPTLLSLQPYGGSDADLAALTAIRNDTLRATTRPEDFSEATSEGMDRFYNRGDFTLTGNAWLLRLAGEPAAAAIVYPKAAFQDTPPGNFHLYVVPRFSKHGLGSRLLDHLEQAAAARGYPVLETTVAAEDQKSTRFLLNHGFGVVGRSIHLSLFDLDRWRDPARPDPAPIPSGFAIRSLADLQEPPDLYLETANRLGAHDLNYSLITPEDLQAQIDSDRWDPAGALLLFDPTERIIGVIRASFPEPTTGYLSEVRLEPASRGKGLGTPLVGAAVKHIAARGAQRADLDTPGENTAARNLALRAGFQETRHWLHYLKRL